MFEDGAIVWVNLGVSYGWWPAKLVLNEGKKRVADENDKNNKNVAEDVELPSKDDSKTLKVQFFDDHPLEYYRLGEDASRLKAYSGDPDKLTLVLAGLVKLDESGLPAAQFASTRQSQFIKDVEMAEVLSGDADPEVVNLLSQYVLDSQPEEPKPKKRKRRRRR